MEKHHCKVCGKRFPTGRSLGGHMRSHLPPPPPPPDHHRPPPVTETKPRYGLRENPKKKRLVDLAAITHHPFRPQRSSKEAGKQHGQESEVVMAMAPVRKRRSAAECEYELELEEGAISLMMLSRGVGFWRGDAAELASDVSDYHWNLLNKTESDVSDYDDDDDDDDKALKKPKLSAFDGNSMEKDQSCNLDGQGNALSKIESFDAYSAKFLQRTGLYECTSCNKTFHSYQALGGHRASNKRSMGGKCRQDFNGSSKYCLEMNTALGNGTGYRSSVKIKSHECFICGKVFQSGQALGGHKRAHLMASSNDGVCSLASHEASVNKQQSPAMPDLIGLNIPAPVDGKSTNANGNSVFKPWWIESNLKHEQLIGVISS